ncbi:hypothetical protein ACP70R_015252 [Stipagrostis hirtigluma subsp. patula]
MRTKSQHTAQNQSQSQPMETEITDQFVIALLNSGQIRAFAVKCKATSIAQRVPGDPGSPSNVPRVELPEELFANIGAAASWRVNKVLGVLKQFLLVIAGFFTAAIIGSRCNFLTVICISKFREGSLHLAWLVCAHTLPAFYEKHQDQVADFLDSVLGHSACSRTSN